MEKKKSKVNEKNLFILPKFYPRNFQLDVLTEARIPNSRIAVSAARGSGKDFVGLQAAYERAVTKPGSNIGYLATSIKQLKKIVLFNDVSTGKPAIETIIDTKQLEKNNKNKYYKESMSAVVFKNGSILYFLGSDSSAELGNSLDMLVISESARITRSSWRHLIPSVERANGVIIEVSTVLNGSEFNQLLDNEIAGAENYKRFIIKAPDVREANGKLLYPPKRLERIKSQMDEATFNEDYMCDTKAINMTSVLGASLNKCSRVDISPDVEFKRTKRRFYTSFDLGHDDDCVMFIHYEDSETKFPVLVDSMIARQTNLVDFTKKLKDLEKEWYVHGIDSIIILPFDACQTKQGFNTSLNVRKEFKNYMPKNPIVVAKKLPRQDSLRVTRQVIETGRYPIANGVKGDKLIQILGSIRYKEKDGRILTSEIDKKSGEHGDHPLDSTKTYITWFFDKLFDVKNYSQNELNQIDIFYPGYDSERGRGLEPQKSYYKEVGRFNNLNINTQRKISNRKVPNLDKFANLWK